MVKNLSAKQTMQARSLVWEDPPEEEMAPRSSILAWEIHRQRSLVGDNPGGRKESDATERLKNSSSSSSIRLLGLPSQSATGRMA